ncbi:MAG: hypothetical protein E3J29_00595, partial [Dehalococcoidia bacterium]
MAPPHRLPAGRRLMTSPDLAPPRRADLRRLAENALAEDRAYQDVTTAALVPDDQRGSGVIIAKAEGVLAGLPVARAVFLAAASSLAWPPPPKDGAPVSPGGCGGPVAGARPRAATGSARVKLSAHFYLVAM